MNRLNIKARIKRLEGIASARATPDAELWGKVYDSLIEMDIATTAMQRDEAEKLIINQCGTKEEFINERLSLQTRY